MLELVLVEVVTLVLVDDVVVDVELEVELDVDVVVAPTVLRLFHLYVPGDDSA